MTNISDIVTATATANVSSGVRLPVQHGRLTFTGEATERSTSSERSRLSIASEAKP